MFQIGGYPLPQDLCAINHVEELARGRLPSRIINLNELVYNLHSSRKGRESCTWPRIASILWRWELGAWGRPIAWALLLPLSVCTRLSDSQLMSPIRIISLVAYPGCTAKAMKSLLALWMTLHVQS
ncbi:hypothetical protein VN97_g1454 [Penicillium thymicola]|uniref:Uncharacterized protein n=1 Tax=Penicillium thymicola TaxID=293382 RepID=A0AAI9TQZ1_PENTH|nr:hypothetical protein VN97_g1454 [Penicillium thymicola]